VLFQLGSACWTRNGLLVCHSDADCEENAKCNPGRVCACRVSRGTCECLLEEDAVKEASNFAEEGAFPGDAAASLPVANSDSQARRAMLIADKDGDGRISREEAKEALAQDADPEEQAELFNEIDADSDGFISLDELEKSLSDDSDEKSEL